MTCPQYGGLRNSKNEVCIVPTIVLTLLLNKISVRVPSKVGDSGARNHTVSVGCCRSSVTYIKTCLMAIRVDQARSTRQYFSIRTGILHAIGLKYLMSMKSNPSLDPI